MNLTTQCPVQLDLGTINEVQQVVVRALRDLVCNWEQKAHDAGLGGDWRAAQQCTEWAFAAEIAASRASLGKLWALFFDVHKESNTLRGLQDLLIRQTNQ
jgi:hypothetical protein